MSFVILGGTGTLGKELARQLLKKYRLKITIVSRDELKQKEMAHEFQSDRLHFKLGDVRDRDSLRHVISVGDAVFHVAAIKHVDVCEENVEECIKTNILGTINVADISQENRANHVVFSSTDKAVDPINAYGMSKGISERLLLNRNKRGSTRFSVFRWGNVLGSRGSVIHPFVETLTGQGTVYLTHEDMTRFWIPIEQAVTFMIDNFATAPANEVMIPPIKAAPVKEVAASVARALNIPKYKTQIVGKRPGEKLHEMLRSVTEKSPLWSGAGPRFTPDELDSMIKPIVRGIS